MKLNEEEVKTWHILIFMIIMGWMIFMIYDKPEIVYDTVKTDCKQDSLQTVINQLQSDMAVMENGWDNKEKRYEDILFEYQFGLDHLKDYHPKAYEEFHRIIGFKERFSRETEKENIERLKKSINE
jgi:hypothetical protein